MTIEVDIDRFDLAIGELDRWLLLFGGRTPLGAHRANRICRSAIESDVTVIWYNGMPDALSSCGRLPQADNPQIRLVDYSAPKQGKWWQFVSEPSRQPRSPIRRTIWNTVERPFRSVVRPYATWRALRPSLMKVASGQPPIAIAFCDDSVIPSAWHMARIWPSCPVVKGVPNSWK